MAHGFLTPESVSGDNFWRNVNYLWEKLQQLKKRNAPPEEVVPVVVDELQKALPPGRQKLLSPGAQKLLSGRNQSALGSAKASNMLDAAPVAKMLDSGKSEITIKQQLSLPPGGPKLPPSGDMPGKGGTFTNIPGVSAAPKKLDSEAFFKAAQTGVDPQTGRYLSSEERKDFLKKSTATMNAPASVAAGGINSASSIVQVTKGDEEIVSSVENLTQVVVSLVSAVKAQTAAQLKAATAQKASTERTANRALAAAEESSLEQSTDLSGTITPSGGMGSMTPSSARGSGGGGGGGPAFGIGGKAIAQAVGKRGLSRALPRLGAHVAGKTGAKLGAKAATKIGVGAVGKSLAKKIPGLGLVAGLGFGAQRLLRGDFLGAGLEVASGAASTLPGLGTVGSIGIDAALAARDMGATPFATGGIISSPTLSMMGEGNKKEGVFPLEGKEGKKTFEMFGQGMIDAQKKNKREYASIQSAGLRQYYENEGGGEKLGKSLASIWSKIGGVLGSLFSGTLNSLLGGAANAATGNPADYLNSGIGGSTAERNAAAFLSTLEGSGGQTAADTFQVMLNRTANAKSGGSMKAYGSTLFDQITAQSQFSPFSAAINDRATGDPAADKKYGSIRAKLGKNAAERKAKLLEIAGQPDGLAQLQKLFNAGSGAEAAKVLADFESGGKMSKSSAQFVGGAMSFRGYETAGSRRRSEGGNYFFGAAQGTAAASLNAVSAEPSSGVLDTGRLPALPKTGTMHGQNYGAHRDGGRKHAGVDFDISGNEKFFSRIGGEVIFAGWGGSGYGNTVDIYNKDLNVTERIAEGAKLLVSQGATVKPGAAIAQGESKTGVIHYEIRKGRSNGSGSFEGTLNPLNFLSSLSSKNKDTASGGGGAPGAPRAASRGGQRGSGSSPGSLQASAAAPPAGVQLAQASTADAVSRRRNTRGGGTTVINNNNVQSGSGAQVASSGPAGGSGSMGLGALAIRLAS